MESTLHDLGQLLLKAIPTLFLLLVVHFYLKQMFFRPMADVLAKRRAATDGLRESAEAMRAKAVEQTKAIEAQLRQAREAIYQEQEEARRGWTGDQSAQLDEARQQSARADPPIRGTIWMPKPWPPRANWLALPTTWPIRIAQTLLERTSA